MNEATESRMNGATTSRAERRERWRGLAAEQRASGESKRAFCRGRGLSYPRFLAWVKRFAENTDPSRHEGFADGSRRRATRLAPDGEGAQSGRLADARGRVLSRGTRALPERRRPADAFCEVRVGAPVFEIASGAVVVRVPSGFDAGELARLLRAVFEVSRSIADATRTTVEAARPC